MSNDGVSIDSRGDISGTVVGVNNGTIQIQPLNIVNMPSRLATIVKLLGDVCTDDEDTQSLNLGVFKPEEKIEYNCVKQYRQIIQEHAIYYYQCEEIMNVYDNSHVGSKRRILHCIKIWYLKFKGELLLSCQNDTQQEIEIVRSNADLLIDKVFEKITHIIQQSSNSNKMNLEDMDVGIYCFVCYSFMKCRILEKPP